MISDPFHHQLGQGWSWIREHPGAWRMTDEALEIKVEPGNMWGGANNAKNILVRDVPVSSSGRWTISATFFNQPTEQYEQVDLVWYYNDSYQVKIGQELVDGQLSIVMGREEKDRTKTIAIIPLDTFEVAVKLEIHGERIQGSFKKRGVTYGRRREKRICRFMEIPVSPSNVTKAPQIRKDGRVFGILRCDSILLHKIKGSWDGKCLMGIATLTPWL